MAWAEHQHLSPLATAERSRTHGDHGEHDKHAGHDPEMFRRLFWWNLVLAVPVLVFSGQIQDWFDYSIDGGWAAWVAPSPSSSTGTGSARRNAREPNTYAPAGSIWRSVMS